MAPATVEIGAAQDLELGGGSQNSMTLAEAAIPAHLSGTASTIVGLMIAAVVIRRRIDGDHRTANSTIHVVSPGKFG
uniref:Uncharacterized protein n=1 Tax=Candidatus Methanogaster sp. ANME-2c ERB4 TaxID=2759911 RepID=A0A7G9YLQ8_9EURY|nr:hypothetical protein JAJEHNPH_00010 [Methanosarcinales archaeon ANME-2c ERB4]QNO48942.1 hypothetical protein OEPDFBKK_00018 [Methanosarcinales archaeon ANME-2c ERB4]